MEHCIAIELEVDEAKNLLAGWEASLDRMLAEKAALEERIGASQTRIASLRAKLTGQELLPETLNRRQPGTGTESERTPKGQNLKVVSEFLKSVAPTAKTATEIARQTNIGVSSVCAVLNRNQEFFKKEEDGRWRIQ